MEDTLLDLLRSVDTPSVCNAIEVAQGKRGFNAFTRGTLVASDPTHPAICGYARTARIRGLAPPQEDPAVIRGRRMGYYQHMSEGPRPSIAVVEDLDGQDKAIGAYWGEINTTIHKGFGLSGALTNGVVRDLGDNAPGFPVLAGSIGPSHGFVHVVDYGEPVAVFGMTVRDSDFVHADRHGAVVVPPEVLPGLAAAIRKMQETEQIVLSAARRDDFDFAKFEAAWSAFEAART